MPIRRIQPLTDTHPHASSAIATRSVQDASAPMARQSPRLRPTAIAQAEDETAPLSAPEQPFAIGYKKPPKHTQFKPGHSGNPKGRPKAAKSLRTIARETLTSKVAVRTAVGEKRMSRIEAVLHKTVEQAMKGNPRALGELLKLYAAAVPESAPAEQAVADEDLCATDLAILEQFKSALLEGEGQ